MPAGKPAGVVCVNLDPGTSTCLIWGAANYPLACRRFLPEPSVCGDNTEEALQLIAALEIATR